MLMGGSIPLSLCFHGVQTTMLTLPMETILPWFSFMKIHTDCVCRYRQDLFQWVEPYISKVSVLKFSIEDVQTW